MPRKKKLSVRQNKSTSLEETPSANSAVSSSLKILKTSSVFSLRNIILIGVLVLGVLGWKFKGYFIAATVNGQPISRFELTSQLIKRFGQQTLEGIVGERLILGAARQKGIFISTEDINSRIKQIEERLQGQMSLSDALKAQGLTMDDLKRQIEVRLSIDKLFDKEATVSTGDIDDYLKTNSQTYKNATDPAAVREEIKAVLKQQKISDLFDKWFSDLRKNAKVNIFL